MKCVFCKIIAGEISTEFIYKDKDVVAFSDINPCAPIHILIIPRKHIETLNQSEITGKMVSAAYKIAKDKKISDSGFRLIFNSGPDAGQEVTHIHLHLLGGEKLGSMIGES